MDPAAVHTPQPGCVEAQVQAESERAQVVEVALKIEDLTIPHEGSKPVGDLGRRVLVTAQNTEDVFVEAIRQHLDSIEASEVIRKEAVKQQERRLKAAKECNFNSNSQGACRTEKDPCAEPIFNGKPENAVANLSASLVRVVNEVQ